MLADLSTRSDKCGGGRGKGSEFAGPKFSLWSRKSSCAFKPTACCTLCVKLTATPNELKKKKKIYLVWPFPQHTARPPSLPIYGGSAKVLIEILLTVHYTNPWPLIPIIPAYCIVINHSRACKYKSFHLSLYGPRIIAVSFPQKRSRGESPAANRKQAPLWLDTLICSYSVQAPCLAAQGRARCKSAIADIADTVAN